MINCESCIHNHKMHEMTSPPLGCHGHGCQSDMLSGMSASSKENKLQNFCSALLKCDHKPLFSFSYLSFPSFNTCLSAWDGCHCSFVKLLTGWPFSFFLLFFFPEPAIYLITLTLTNWDEIGNCCMVAENSRNWSRVPYIPWKADTHSTWGQLYFLIYNNY